MSLFKISIIGTYISADDNELLSAYLREIKNLKLKGLRSRMTLKENENFKVRCKYLVVTKSGAFAQSMLKPKGSGCRPIKKTAIK